MAVDGLDDVFLGLAFQMTKQTLFYPLVDLRVGAHGTNHNTCFTLTALCRSSRYFLKVGFEIGNGQFYTTVLAVGKTDGLLFQLPGVGG